MADAVAQAEKAKYQKMWAYDSYRERSPGMRFLADAIYRMKMPEHSTVVDLGCGTGRVAAALSGYGHSVTAVDIASNACTEFDGPFVQAPLWALPAELGRHDYGYCADVMEHLPTAKVPMSLACIAAHCGTVFFQIANFECHEGDKIGEHLHLTVKSIDWWRAELRPYFAVIEAVPSPKHHVFVCKSLAF